MEKFTVEQYPEAKAKAKELGINTVGKTKQTVVDLVNAALENGGTPVTQPAAPRVKKEKWHANGFGFQAGDRVIISSKTITKAGVTKEILQGREAQIIKPGLNEGTVKAYLVDENGQVQKCPITLFVDRLTLKSEVTPTVEETNEQQAS